MAEDVQSILATAFNEIAAGLTAAATSVGSSSIAAATEQADSNASTTGTGTRNPGASSQSSGGGSSVSNSLLSLVSPTAAGAAGAASGGTSTAGKIASFLPMGGLIEGLIGLFGGGSSTPEPLTKYALPASVDFLSNLNANGTTSAADFNQNGAPRAYSDNTGGNGTPNGPSSINLTINALDSQSILSRADDIAAAVRGAMLNGNSINDVINNDL